MQQQDKNAEVVNPLKEANDKVKELEKKRVEHEKIKNELVSCQGEIDKSKNKYKESEWEYEVKLQKFQYLDKEK